MATYFKINCGLSLVLICSCFKGTDALCSQTSAGIKRFGTDCRLACHCMDNEQCSTTTGECDSGCDFEWVGPGCQYKNIALGQLYRQLDNKDPPEYAYNAIDRSLSTCSFTNTSDAAKWRTVAPWLTVWLPYYAPFREIIFTTKTEYLPQFPRFNLTVQNISKSDSENKVYNSAGELCYQHDTSIPTDATIKVTCTGTPVGNQIRLQLANTSTQLLVCDFRVYGECRDRTWGKPCVNECGLCKDLSQCDATSGRCPTGCEPGYTTSFCNEECVAGKYGQNCSQNCSGNCKDNITCETHSGTCLNSCILGYTGTKCEKACAIGYYGHECKQQCSPNCAGGHVNCDKVYGTCSAGCNPGWTGRKCQEACRKGQYGLNCANQCRNCLSNACRNTDGLCSGGCIPGLKDTPFCDEECEDGTYGLNCKKTCNENCNDICNKTYGYCQGCKSGWFGFKCSTECMEGSWGEDCQRTCGKCMDGSCDRFNGACSGSCKPGYKFKRYCDEECETGRYGNNCTGQCSPACKDLSLCRKADGYCAKDSSAATTNVIAGVGTALIIVIILGVLVILWYQRRTRNGSDGNTREIQSNQDVSMIDLSDKTKRVKSNEETDASYETAKGNTDITDVMEDIHKYGSKSGSMYVEADLGHDVREHKRFYT